MRSELTEKIESVRAELTARIDETNRRIDETNKRIDELRAELTERIESVRSELTERYDRLNLRMDQLGKDIVRRNEHEQLLRQYEHRITSVEKTVEEIKRRVAVAP